MCDEEFSDKSSLQHAAVHTLCSLQHCIKFLSVITVIIAIFIVIFSNNV